MKMKRLVKFASVFVAAALLFSCDLIGGEDNNSSSGSVDFTNYRPSNSYSILVTNHTNERLVAFRGDLHPDMLIGGIPANASNHGLPRNPALFGSTQDFPLILLTEGQYDANKNNLSSPALKNAPFTRVFVFFNASGDNTAVHEIASGLGGQNRLRVTNNSNSMNIELRLGGVAGETLGYAPAKMMETSIMVADGNYQIFPVFKRYNRERDVLETVYPTNNFGDPIYRTVALGDFGQGQPLRETLLNLHDLLRGLTMSSGSAWVYINNQTQDGMMFLEGSTPRKTLTGLEYTMPGRPLTFQFDMPKLGNTNNYVDSITVANWKFGSSVYNVSLQESESDNAPLTSLTLKRDTQYSVTISGDLNARTLKAWISDESPIDTSEFTM